MKGFNWKVGLVYLFLVTIIFITRATLVKDPRRYDLSINCTDKGLGGTRMSIVSETCLQIAEEGKRCCNVLFVGESKSFAILFCQTPFDHLISVDYPHLVIAREGLKLSGEPLTASELENRLNVYSEAASLVGFPASIRINFYRELTVKQAFEILELIHKYGLQIKLDR